MSDLLKKREKWIDALKGLIISFVVYDHCVKGCLENKMFLQQIEIAEDIYNLFLSFNMPVFFMISGYLFVAAESYKKLKSRITDIFLMFAFWDLFYWASKFFLNLKGYNSVNIEQLLALWYNPIGVYWYLYDLMLLVLAVSLLLKLGMKMNYILCVAICASLVSVVFGVDFNRCMYFLYFFVLGGYIKETALLVKIQVPMIVSLGICAIAIKFWGTGIFMDKLLWPTVIGLFLMSAFCNIKNVGESRLLNTIGSYCLAIYLLHTYFVAATRIAFSKYGFGDMWVYMVVAMLLGLLVPAVIYKLCKKSVILSFPFEPMKTIQKRI